MRTALLLLASAQTAATDGGPLPGKVAFVAVFVVLLVWLLFLPARFINQEGIQIPWWRSVRFWAVVVTLVQIWVYSYWG